MSSTGWQIDKELCGSRECSRNAILNQGKPTPSFGIETSETKERFRESEPAPRSNRTLHLRMANEQLGPEMHSLAS